MKSAECPACGKYDQPRAAACPEVCADCAISMIGEQIAELRRQLNLARANALEEAARIADLYSGSAAKAIRAAKDAASAAVMPTVRPQRGIAEGG